MAFLLYARHEYASATDAIIDNANKNHTRFEAIFHDLVESRYRTLNIAAETMLQNRATMGAFARDDRAELVRVIEPYFATLNKSYGIERLNFWQPPARLYYRAGSPKDFGMDLSAFRKSIVAANEQRARVSAVEAGARGVIAFRVITPVVVDERFVGVFEFVSNFDIPLERASDTTGLKWGISLMKETSEQVERLADPKHDAWQGKDVYYHYSDPLTGQTIRAIKFDARGKEHAIAKTSDGHSIYVKTFPVVDFSGVPTITVATVLDITQAFDKAERMAIIKAVILFVLVSVFGCIAYIKFGNLKATLGGSMGRMQRDLQERTVAFEAVQAKLREADLIKRGFFNNLVTAINGPLQAVVGQLRPLPQAFEEIGASKPAVDRLQFALAEMTHLSTMVEEYQQIEMFRQNLVKGDNPSVSLAAVVAQAFNEDLAPYRRLPQLDISMTMPGELPPTRADADLLRRAISSLVGFAAQRTGRGSIVLSASLEEGEVEWLVLSIAGSAFAGEGAPSEVLLDESRQFLSRQAGGNQEPADGPLVSVVLARIIIEHYGGSLAVSTLEHSPGFVVRLVPAA